MTLHNSSNALILMADDDEDDRDLVRDAFHDAGLPGEIKFVTDGQHLLDYLRGQAGHAQPQRPSIILLDLNMPRKDGREALAEIKADHALREIPIVVLTTSQDQQDITATYRLGANSFIAKPVTHAALVKAMRNLTDYWYKLVELPS